MPTLETPPCAGFLLSQNRPELAEIANVPYCVSSGTGVAQQRLDLKSGRLPNPSRQT